jgi:DNA-binding IclR family transcriptional regulator
MPVVSIANVDRTLALVEALAERPEGASLGALADALAVPKSALHRLLGSLALRGYVVQDAVCQDYRLSLKFATLGFRVLDVRALPDVAQGVLAALAKQSGEYCRLAVVEGDSLFWAARAQGATQGLRYDPPMGRDVILQATASGKAWLATLPEDEALRIVLQRGLQGRPGMGKRAVGTVDELRRHLRDTRRRGYGLAVDEAEAGIVAIAAAFASSPAAGAATAGTVSVAGPGVRFDARRAAELAPHLQAAARELEQLWPVRRRQHDPGAQAREPNAA